ncbi:hypothetical protein BDZ91DRAFT_726596 [Kalaharituber pfeilii]|nr:hypothetical protein BDZ91DRAFT_726596 [Kalaharituber pfeilii]
MRCTPLPSAPRNYSNLVCPHHSVRPAQYHWTVSIFVPLFPSSRNASNGRSTHL